MNTEGIWEVALNELFEEDIKKIHKLTDAGEDLSRAPRISLSTIHGVKGNERENVVVHTELSGAAFEDYQKNQTIHTDCFMLRALEQRTIYT